MTNERLGKGYGLTRYHFWNLDTNQIDVAIGDATLSDTKVFTKTYRRAHCDCLISAFVHKHFNKTETRKMI